MGGELKTSFVEEEREFLRQLDDMMPQHPAPHLTYLQCQHHGAPGGGALPWLTPDSLREIGIQETEELDFSLCQQTQIGYVSSVRTFLSLSSVSSQEIKPSAGKEWVMETVNSSVKSSGGKSRTWWDSFWGGEESLQKELLSDLSRVKERMVTGRLCPKQPEAERKAPAAGTTAAFVQSDIRGGTQRENTGPTDHKEQPANNGGLHKVQNAETSTPDQHLSSSDHLSRSGAATACSEVAVLTPDQDQGYSSLEEEHVQKCQQPEVRVLCEEPPQQEAETTETRANMEEEEESPEEEESASGQAEEQGMKNDEEAEVEEVVLTNPQCQNKAIAFIMGCPCSDDDNSQSEGESSDEDDDDDDDDGFDSEGSSDLSDSSDEEDEADSDSDVDSEAERLWTSLSQNSDPYNPRNFTARLQTRSTPPKNIPASTPPSSAHSTPASSPDTHASSLAASPPLASSPPSGSDSWDDSTSASEVDEAESLRLWSSFSASSDPYSPFNFQASIRTQTPAEVGPRSRARARRTSKTPPCSSHQSPTAPPEYRKEEAEERLDSGFSEPCTSSSSSRKKVSVCVCVQCVGVLPVCVFIEHEGQIFQVSTFSSKS